MSIKLTHLASLLLSVAVSNAFADDKPWTISTGLNYRNSNFTLPSNRNNNESWTSNLGLSRQLNEKTWLGGAISYTDSDIRYKTLNGNGDIETVNVSAFVTRNLAWGLYGNASISYGKLDINNKFPTTQLDTDADYTTASLGLTQYVPLSQQLMSSFNARYTHISSNTDSFITNAGQAVGSSDSTLNYITLGARLDYKLDKLTPFVHLDWQKASREFIQNTSDDDYFSYGVGANYAIRPETNISFSIGSVFDKRYANETSVGINLSHRF